MAPFLLRRLRMDWMTQMPRFAPAFATVLLVAGAMWIGTLFSVSWLCRHARMMADGPEIGRLATSLFGHWTVPSLFVSLVAGAALWFAAFQGPEHARMQAAAVAGGIALLGISIHVGVRARRVGSEAEPT